MASTHKNYYLAGPVGLIIMLLVPAVVFGQSDPTYYANTLNHLIEGLAPTWKAHALRIGRLIFITLIVIDLIFLGVSIALGRIESPTLQVIISRVIIYVIFFAFLFFFEYLGYIVWGFEQMAGYVTGFHNRVNSYQLLKQGWHFLQNVSQSSLAKWSLFGLFRSKGTGIFEVGMAMFFGFIVMVGFFAVALEYAFLQVEVIIMLTIGPIFLGFAPLKPTRSWASRYINTLITLGITLFIFFVILGFAYGTMQHILSIIRNAKNLTFSMEYSLAFFAILTVFLLAKLPRTIADRIMGNANFDVEGLLPRLY